MSKIFEALTKAGGEVSEIALPLIAGETVLEPVYSPAAGIPRHSFAEESAAAEPVSAAHFEVEDSTPATEFRPQMRMLPLRVPSGAPVLPFDGSHPRAAEQYRMVRNKIVHHPDRPRLLVVSSAAQRDGKTVTALNISGALALKNDSNVLLVDADFRRPRVAELLGLPAEPGLAEVLRGELTLGEVIIRTQQFPNLYVVPSGRAGGEGARPNPAELLDSPRWRSACSTFQKDFRFTVVDAPPIQAVADYDLIQAACDGVIFVARPDHTNRTLCLQALRAVPRTKLVGVLLNCTEEWFMRKTQNYYYASGAEQP